VNRGRVQLGPQIVAEMRRRRCEDRASDIYALYGKRITDCACGFHTSVVPVDPSLLQSVPPFRHVDPDEIGWTTAFDGGVW
jgi:hypothetical protein